MTDPLILSIEAATDVCSVCLSRGSAILSLHESIEQNEHSRLITLLIERCMAEAHVPLTALDAVAVSEGPGSYTSLRVGFSTAKGLCYSLGIPLLVVNTLEALALEAARTAAMPGALYCSMIDARRMEVYAALYDWSAKQVMPPTPIVIDGSTYNRFFGQGRTVVFSGNGAEKCKSLFDSPKAVFSGVKKCSATQIILPAMNSFLNKNFADVAYSVPLYLKPPNITVSRGKPS